jgi:pyruvate dehydrogenase E2 component (dihydrolipoyllysine-residue acetyltransferase)
VAVVIDGGLLTPIVRRAETKSLSAILTEVRDLIARAHAKNWKARISGRRHHSF